MNLEECYLKLHGDYEQVKQRLFSDNLIEKFLLKFPQDDSIQVLRKGVIEKDHELAFRGAHTLKGVAANLSFTELYKAASDLTEQLRGNDEEVDIRLLERVENSYSLIIDTINEYK